MDTLTKLYLETDALNKQRDNERREQKDRIYMREQLTRLKNNLNRDLNEKVDFKSRCELLIQYKEFYIKLKQESCIQGKDIKAEVCDVFIKEIIEPIYSLWKEKYNLELLSERNDGQQDKQQPCEQIAVKKNGVHNYEEVGELLTSNRATKEQKEQYFMLLSISLGKNKKVIMTKDQVMEFLSINFKEFRLPGTPAPEQKFFIINLKTKVSLIYFLYQFYFHFDDRGSKMEYAMLLKNNFLEFNDMDVNNIITNFSKKPSKINTIPTVDFFKTLKQG